MSRLKQRLPWLIVALVVVYSVSVLYQVRTRWDLGVYCLFSDDEPGPHQQLGPKIGWVTGEIVGADVPHPGDRLLRIAGEAVPTVIDLEQRTSDLSPPGSGAPAAEVISPGHLTSLPAGVDLAQVDGDRWVRIEFWRDTAGGGERLSSWVRLQPTPTATVLMSLSWFLLEMAILAIGTLVVWKRPGDFAAAMLFALCVVNVVTFIGAFHWISLVGNRLLIYPFIVCALLLAPMTLHFYMLVPRPLGLLRRWPRATLISIYVAPAAWMCLMFVCLLRVSSLLDRPERGAELAARLQELTWLIYAYLAISALMLLVAQGALLYGFFNCRTVAERRQASWLLAAAVIASGPVLYLMRAAMTDRAEFAYGSLPRAMVYATSLVFTLAYAISITRSKLMQVGRIVNRGILYVAISFAATALFCLMVGITTTLVGSFYFRWENALVAGITAMLVVVLLGWIRDRFQKALDRKFYREKYQLDKAMRRLSDAVDQLVEPAQFARQLLTSALETVGAERGAVYLRGDGEEAFALVCRGNWTSAPPRIPAGDRLAATPSSPPAEATRISRGDGADAADPVLRQLGADLCCRLELESKLVGLLVLGPKSDRGVYTAEDRNFLAALARTTTMAIHSAQGHRTIDALREELKTKVHKIAEQQRRIVLLQAELQNPQRDPPPQTADNPPAPADGALVHDIRGSSPAVARMLSHVGKVARTSSSVLIRGESGTGKELLARAIHFNSLRRDGPFVQVHCAALSQGLLESELFGHVKGAFTGADRDKVGRFELADGGTLLLDEIGDVNLETQTKLVRVLQERSFERVGSSRSIEVDVRLIAATHRNLEDLIRQGRFREDLFYRLNVISLRCPPLRERRDDIFELALHFLRVYARRAGKAIARIDDEAFDALSAYSWPGNVRQLENAIERAVVLAEGDAILRADLPPEILAAAHDPAGPRSQRAAQWGFAAPDPAARRNGLDDEITELERGRVVEALALAGGNKSEAARQLGMPRSTLLSKLRRLRLA